MAKALQPQGRPGPRAAAQDRWEAAERFAAVVNETLSSDGGHPMAWRCGPGLRVCDAVGFFLVLRLWFTYLIRFV